MDLFCLKLVYTQDNINDFEGCESFGIKAIRPKEFLKRIGGLL